MLNTREYMLANKKSTLIIAAITRALIVKSTF